jgi:hypothetical protein
MDPTIPSRRTPKMNHPVTVTALLLPCTLAFTACNGDLAVAENGQDGGSSSGTPRSSIDLDSSPLPGYEAGCLSCSSPGAEAEAEAEAETEAETEASVDGTDDGPVQLVSQPAVHAAACLQTCSAPAGTVQSFSTAEEVYQALVGPWQICPGASGTFPGPSDVIGVEYGPASYATTVNGSTVGGNMYYLVQGPSGPVRGSGFAYQLTYDVSPEGPGSFQLNMHPAPNSGFGGSFRYSPCPTQFWMQGSPSGSAVIIPFS